MKDPLKVPCPTRKFHSIESEAWAAGFQAATNGETAWSKKLKEQYPSEYAEGYNNGKKKAKRDEEKNQPQKSVPAKTGKTCPACKEKMDAADKFCESCGTPAEE